MHTNVFRFVVLVLLICCTILDTLTTFAVACCCGMEILRSFLIKAFRLLKQ